MVNSSTLKPITTSTFSFPDVIGKGFVYVDKTEYVRELLRDGKNQYFCARPRRFGKSLLISTLQCVFEGRRELFKGLAIDSSDYDLSQAAGTRRAHTLARPAGSPLANVPSESLRDSSVHFLFQAAERAWLPPVGTTGSPGAANPKL